MDVAQAVDRALRAEVRALRSERVGLDAELVVLRKVEHRARSFITREDLDYTARFDLESVLDELDRLRGRPPVHEIPRDARPRHAR